MAALFRTKTALWPLLVLVAITAVGLPGADRVEAKGPPDLDALHERLLPVFGLGSIVFTDADETTGRLVIGVENRGIQRSLEARIKNLGVPLELVDIVESPPIVQMATLQQSTRPLLGGTQIHFGNYLCTAGFNAISGSRAGFVTNSHCTNKQGGTESTKYYQPLSSVEPTSVGTEYKDPTYKTRTSLSACPVGKVCRYSDSAFVRYTNGTTGQLGKIARTTGPNNGSITIDPNNTFNVIGKTTHSVGTVVNKVGRTTGWSQASVSRTCVHTGVSGTSIVQLCQSWVASSSKIVGGGDSGSAVFSIASGNDVRLQGILWGGTTDGKQFIFSPMANIERSDELGSLTAWGSSNNSPTAANQSVSTDAGTPLVVTLSGTDAETCNLTFAIVTAPTKGSLGSIANQSCVSGSPNSDTAQVTYTPNSGASGSDSFVFRVTDGNGATANGTVSITINAVEAGSNSSPTAVNQSVSTNQGTSVVVTMTGRDAETCNLTFAIVSGPSKGSLGSISNLSCSSGSPNTDTARVTYSPNSSATGSDSFVFSVTDGNGATATATVSITINAVVGPTSMHIADLDGSSARSSSFYGSPWTANVTITVRDNAGGLVSNATVTGSWSIDSGTVSCKTDSKGQCVVSRSSISYFYSSVSFKVTKVTHTSLTYNSGANTDPDGDSNGTTIVVKRP